jgi:PKD repeat protein
VSVATVLPLTNVSFQIWVSGLSGLSAANGSLNVPLAIELSQTTIGVKSNVSLSFGDGSANQIFSLTGSSGVISNHTYNTTGTFTVTLTVFACSATNSTYSVNNLTVTVPGKYEITLPLHFFS